MEQKLTDSQQLLGDRFKYPLGNFWAPSRQEKKIPRPSELKESKTNAFTIKGRVVLEVRTYSILSNNQNQQWQSGVALKTLLIHSSTVVKFPNSKNFGQLNKY